MTRRQATRLLLLGGALATAFVLGRRLPKDQTVHYVLGDAAARVLALDARWAEGDGEEWMREASFRYPAGGAPRVVTHEPRLPDGDYTVEVDLRSTAESRTVRRHVTLSGGATSIDLSGGLSGEASAR